MTKQDRRIETSGAARLVVETPEQVSFELPLAGPGSRFGALVVDALCLVWVGLAVGFGILFLSKLAGDLPFLGALLGAVALLLFWGWFFAFETLWDGCTPGKRAFGLRVVRADGSPLGTREAAIRNLVRIIDLQPGFSCALGGFSMLLDKSGRRLGDLAAGTVVVRDQKIAFPVLPEVRPGTTALPVRLGDEAFGALSAFLGRSRQLEPEVEQRLAARFALQLADLDPGGSASASSASKFVTQFHAEEVVRRAGARRSLDAGAPSAVRQLEEKRDRWVELSERFGSARRPKKNQRPSAQDEQGVAEDAAHLRELSSDLARARTYGAAAGTVLSLERLVAGAHARLYRAAPLRWSRLREFLLEGFPERVRGARHSVLLATLLFAVPLVVTFAFLVTNPEWELALAGEGMIERARAAAANPGYDYRDTWESVWSGSEALSTNLIAHNVHVVLLAFAGGMTLGLASAFVLVTNGISLGAGFAVFANRGVFENILTFVLPHGGIELTAVVLSGAAAFHLASGFWRPGRRGRGVRLRECAREAVAIVVGVVLMLILAGVIEGYLSPARLPAPVKWAAGGLAVLGLVLYFGRGKARSQGAGRLDLEVAGDSGLDSPARGDVEDRHSSLA